MSGTYALLKDTRIVRIVGERSLDKSYTIMNNPLEVLDLDKVTHVKYSDVVVIDSNLNMLAHQQSRTELFKFIEMLNSSIFKHNIFKCTNIFGGERWITVDDLFTFKFFNSKDGLSYSLYFGDDEITYDSIFTKEYILKSVIQRVIRKNSNIFKNPNHKLYAKYHKMLALMASDTLTFYNLVNYLNENITFDDPLIYDMEGFCPSKNNTYMLSNEDGVIDFSYNGYRIYQITENQSFHTLAIDIRLELVKHCQSRMAHHTAEIKKYITLENKFSVSESELKYAQKIL